MSNSNGLILSWVESANHTGCPFPLNNLPYGVFAPKGGGPRCGVAIGESVLDVAALEAAGLITLPSPLLDQAAWNPVMAAGPALWADLRAQLTALLRDSKHQEALTPHLHKLAEAKLFLPFKISEYTDFYAGRHHAENVGTMFRGAENALPPNWLHIPIGYNGRASSVVVSGSDIRRPWGQLKGPQDALPRFAPSARFDIELELGAVVGVASQGPVSVAEAEAMIFGYVLLNDWSARDIQAWEYQPLGPFQSKATATTISPWIIPKAALEPFRVAPPARLQPLLPHLQDQTDAFYDIALEVALQPQNGPETVISRTNARELYYSAAQQLAHHTSCGCPMNTGDLLGSGTISGPEKTARGSLLELSWGGAEPIAITGGTRTFIEDNDLLTLRAQCNGAGYTIGFGPCTGRVLPALPNPYERT